MTENLRGNPKVTKQKDLWRVLRLADATKNDIFCDLGCGYGNLCRWAVQKVSFAIGTEDHKDRFRKAIKNTQRHKNVKILNENYRLQKTLLKLRKGTIFYSTNAESLGFYRKFEKIVKPKTRLVMYYLPPYPILPDSFDDWYYLLTTPFKTAKTKNDWTKSVSNQGTFSKLNREIRIHFVDHQQRILDLNEEIVGIDWIRKKN